MPKLSKRQGVDLDAFIIDRDANAIVDGPVELIGHDRHGKLCASTDQWCVAKRSFDAATGISNYWLKRATAGPDAGCLYNPQSPNFQHWAEPDVNPATGRGRYEWVRASVGAYECYLRFLMSGNLWELRQAERE